MPDPDNSCPFDQLDAAMRDPFLQQAFRQLDQCHRYGIIARVCRSWHHLSTTSSSSSLTVEVSPRPNEETGEADAAISFSIWLQRNIGNLTRLDLTLKLPGEEEEEEMLIDTYDGSEMLQTISGATQLCSLRLYLDYRCPSECFVGLSALTNLTSLALGSCGLRLPAFSSILTLTQLKALDLRYVDVHVNEETILPDLTSSLVNLTSLTLDNFSGLGNVGKGLACIRSLTKLVGLDIRNMSLPSGDLVPLVGGLPMTRVKIRLDDPRHVPEVAAWLERCLPTTLRCLCLYHLSPVGGAQPLFEAQSSQVSRLLSPLRSAGPQLWRLSLSGFDLSQGESASIIAGLSQLTSLELFCKFGDDGWALLEPAFVHLEILKKERVVPFLEGISSFCAEVFLRAR